MYEEQFSKRLAELRTKKGVSARDMSLSIGQNPGYIRAIECGTTFPTMSNFFYICEYLNVTPQEFFNFSEEPSNGINALTDQLQRFDSEQIHGIKGEEYTVVIGYDLLNGHLPNWNIIKNKNETLKLLYVLCSRAKSALYLFSETGRTTRTGHPLTSTNELYNVRYHYDTA